MSRQERNAIVIIFDVGNSVSTPLPGDGETFFEKSRDCISWILKRKIFSMANDLVCLLLTGTDEEGESLDDIDVTLCRNISIKYDFQVVSWEMLYYIDKKAKPRDKLSDWVGTLSIAIEKLKILEESYNITSKTIVVFSDLAHTFTEAIGAVLGGIQGFNIEVNVIGSGCFSQVPSEKDVSDSEPIAKKLRLEEEITDMQKDELISGEKLLQMLWNWAGDLITVCSFNSALRHLSCYVKKKVRPTPWNCIMDIGDFKISVQVFKKVDRKPPLRPNLKCQKPGRIRDMSDLSEVKRDKIMYYRHADGKNFDVKEISVEEDDVIAGFRYGASVIPFSDEDKSVLGYKPGKKCFSVLGFTQVHNVPYYALVGEGCYIVVPRDKDQCAERALSALVQAMSEAGTVAIVRRVYSDDRGLSLGVLYPIVEELGESNYKECLIYIELAFHEDLRVVRLPRLRRIKKKITEKQYDIIDNLIDEMDLMKVPSGDKDEFYEELELSKRYEVKNQFFSHCMVQRALYPNKPLPKEIPEYCLKSVILPDSIVRKIEKFDEKLGKLFPVVKKVEEEESRRKIGTGIQSKEEQKPKTKSWENEKTAEKCFKRLFEVQDFPPCEEIQTLLESCVSKFNFKPEDIIDAFLKETQITRRSTLQKYTDDYNFWLRKMRIYLGTEKELERKYWKGIVEGKLGLITVEEHKSSNTNKEDADFFIKSLKVDDEPEEERMITSKDEEDAINMMF